MLLQVEVALTDGTDLKAYRRGHPVLLGPPPSPFGHEVCGTDVATGRRVVVANSAPCGACPPCARGQETLCESLFPLLNGAYAELLLVPERIARRNLLPVPAGTAHRRSPRWPSRSRAASTASTSRACSTATPWRSSVLGPIGLMLCACVADAGGRPVDRRWAAGAARAGAALRGRAPASRRGQTS